MTRESLKSRMQCCREKTVMTRESLKSRMFSMFLAMIANGLILMGILQLSCYENQKIRTDRFDPVFLTHYRAPPPPDRPRNKPEPKERRLEKMPTVFIKQKRVVAKRPVMKFRIPRMNFQINPVLRTDMAIAPPPEPLIRPEPVIQPEPVVRPEPVIHQVVKAEPAAEPQTDPEPGMNAEPAPESIATQGASPEPVQAPPTELGMDDVDQKPGILKKVNPTYPHRARRRNIRGKVTVKFLVSVNGDVTRPSIVKAHPKGIFEQSVLKAIREWRFTPGYYKGNPIPTWVVLPIQFNLNG